ncbi:polysaccharide deacetylase family protein [Jiangella asiatica]|uniref:Polysaccharide deacetylase family protein n=1 Tax=Jiangella asiatica TaxID=2530372 RepID=A0A4R5DC98_9ACTN|nr:polysaccharide deacetylase family protein [Jiangella asiatica]TDE09441.1 polysaccharide deacetylase family protein [Jiangella asiatica]
MNQLSWPATILLGILLGLAAVGAERSADDEGAAAAGGATASPTASSDGGDGPDSGSGSGESSGDSSADSDGETSPDTGGEPLDYSVTLTFDDGPHPVYTPQVLELLDQYDATAVFCVVGQRLREHPEVVRQIVDAGHALCNHTDTHDDQLSERDRDEIEQQIAEADEAIDTAVGDDVAVRYFRQPNTAVQPEVEEVLDEFGLEPLDWTVDPRDWSRPGTMSIVQDVLGQIRPGAVILLHDGGGDRSQTVAALEQILAGLDAAGYRTVLPGDS